MAKSEEIPFEVSARTARLIGRENVASAEGALIELVKNCYDADANSAIVFFDNRLACHLDEIPAELFPEILERIEDAELIESCYQPSEDGKSFILTLPKEPNKLVKYKKHGSSEKAETELITKENVQRRILRLSELWIIDDGEGMSSQTIKDKWMVIGTDSKAYDPFTTKKRAKAGAKGIGRFALDRLGVDCCMYTKQKGSENDEGLKWELSWSSFEGRGKLLGDVTATLTVTENVHEDAVTDLPDSAPDEVREAAKKLGSSGTILRIVGLADLWNERSLTRFFSSLRILVPPAGSQPFHMLMKTSSHPNSFGAVKADRLESFDYKVDAKFDKDGDAVIEITRREFDAEKIDPKFFGRPKLQSPEYQRPHFGEAPFVVKTSVAELLKLDKDSPLHDVIRNLGAFQFVYHFLKRDSQGDDAKRFCWRAIDSGKRRKWLDTWGGIRIYMDNFRARPYGELNSPYADWLQLGQRRYESPAAVSRSGAWRAPPQNIAGSVQLSRVSNPKLTEKAGREGFLETDELRLLRNLLIATIRVFEDDRSFVSSELLAHFRKKNPRFDIEKRAAAATKRAKEGDTSQAKSDITAFMEENEQLRLEAKEKANEMQLLRGLASVGITMSTLAHELHTLKEGMEYRVDELRKVLRRHLPDDQLRDVEDQLNPYYHLTRMEENDAKMFHWLHYSLDSVEIDKRTRKAIAMASYFARLKSTWSQVFLGRQVQFSAQFADGFRPKIRAFGVDLDSIFNNLITNSLEAFSRREFSGDRRINISVKPAGKRMLIRYEDSGPGLHDTIKSPEKILDCHFTTKIDEATGDQVGTGLGMWMVDTIVNDYSSGRVTVLRPDTGFAVEIELPTTTVNQKR